MLKNNGVEFTVNVSEVFNCSGVRIIRTFELNLYAAKPNTERQGADVVKLLVDTAHKHRFK